MTSVARVHDMDVLNTAQWYAAVKRLIPSPFRWVRAADTPYSSPVASDVTVVRCIKPDKLHKLCGGESALRWDTGPSTAELTDWACVYALFKSTGWMSR